MSAMQRLLGPQKFQTDLAKTQPDERLCFLLECAKYDDDPAVRKLAADELKRLDDIEKIAARVAKAAPAPVVVAVESVEYSDPLVEFRKELAQVPLHKRGTFLRREKEQGATAQRKQIAAAELQSYNQYSPALVGVETQTPATIQHTAPAQQLELDIELEPQSAGPSCCRLCSAKIEYFKQVGMTGTTWQRLTVEDPRLRPLDSWVSGAGLWANIKLNLIRLFM